MTDIVFASATQLAADIQAKRLSAAEVLEAHLAQIERHNPALNAIVTMDADRARRQAREADAALARGDSCGPLHGVPFTLKDAYSTAGMRTTVGFPPLADYVPQQDSTVAARLKAAGGVLIGKTNLAEMLADYQSDNPLFGRTNNPWDVERTPGGSSGGAAAALAAGMTPFDIGTDLSGSLRIPAHFCGVFSFKPTEQRVPLTGLIPNPQDTPRSVRIMSCIGPMARTLEDLVLLYTIIAGPDGRDTDIHPVPVQDLLVNELAGLRIAVAPTFPGLPVAADIRQAIEALAQQLAQAGAIVDQARLPELDWGQDLAQAGALIGMIAGAFQPSEGQTPPSFEDYMTALQRRDQSIWAWEQFFEQWDVLLCSPCMTTAFSHCQPGAPIAVDGHDESYWAVSAHTTIFNYSGHPALVLPYTQDRQGLPLGVQVVGKRWDEARLLGIAAAISAVAGAFRAPPGYER